MLSELTAAGNSSALPGYTLSPWTLREYGDAEAEFARAHLATAGAACDSLPADIQDKIIRAATDDVKRKEFCYGRRNFDVRMFDPAMMPFLLWLSLRGKHPALTREEAIDLVTPRNEVQLHRASLECARYKIDKLKDNSSSDNATDWGKIFKALRKRGLGYEQIAGMTIAQVCAEFELSEGEEEKAEVDPVQKRAEIFQEIMHFHGWSKKRLAECPTPQLVTLIKRIGKQTTVDPVWVENGVKEFVGQSSL